MFWQLSAFVGVGVACWGLFLHISAKTNTSFVKFSNARDCRATIAGQNPSPGATANTLSTLQSRAEANKSLQRAFGITNAFTTEDINVQKDFVGLARARMYAASNNWSSIATIASTRLYLMELPKGPRFGYHPRRKIPLCSVVQTLCMTIVLHTILGIEVNNIEHQDILTLAEEINHVWIKSKDDNHERRPVYKNEVALQEMLRKIFPDKNMVSPSENPLNLILPSFETLWRIVLQTFISTVFTTNDCPQAWGQALEDFFNNPTSMQFEQEIDTGISAKSIVFESLRLYPPTRRITRSFHDSVTGKVSVLAADIEACHRDVSVWGTTATRFSPGRWADVTQHQKDSFMPFGGKPFPCPARQDFAPQMVALLAGALVSRYSRGWKLKHRSAGAIKEGEALSRSDFQELYLQENHVSCVYQLN